MHSDFTPHPQSRTSPTPLPGRSNQGSKALVRRARLEHLAAEFLRMGDALRIPVPIQDLYERPPLKLWRIASPEPPIYVTASGDNVAKARVELARAVARMVAESNWDLRLQLLGGKPFLAGEIEVFALAILLPTALLAGINDQQRTPINVARLFQVPFNEVAVRLSELGYTSRQNTESVSITF